MNPNQARVGIPHLFKRLPWGVTGRGVNGVDGLSVAAFQIGGSDFGAG
jgi:hypothetical protein